MQLLAAVDADSATPLVETLIASVGRLRRGMTAVVITPSLDPSWVRPLAALRTRGVACVVVTPDAAAYARYEAATRNRHPLLDDPLDDASSVGEIDEATAKRRRALNHALAEYELRVHTITPNRPLGEILVA
jgi:hypothetical protein